MRDALPGVRVRAQLERSAVPEDLESADLPRLAQAILTEALPALASALVRQDSEAFRSAFRRVARECNSCHRSASRRFIEVPEQPGIEVPVLTPLHGVAR